MSAVTFRDAPAILEESFCRSGWGSLGFYGDGCKDRGTSRRHATSAHRSSETKARVLTCLKIEKGADFSAPFLEALQIPEGNRSERNVVV